MKQFLALIVFAATFSSCRNTETGHLISVDIVRMTEPVIINQQTDRHYLWTSELDQRLGLQMKRATVISADSLNATNIIAILNGQYPEIQLELLKRSNDSIFVRIRKSNYLTRQMGTSGADAYLAEVTYNLTEMDGLNYVDIRFREGDHASPGVYSRTDFVR